MRYLSRKRGAKQATVKEIGRDVFEGSINPTRRHLVQSLLLDYLGLSKTGRETLTLVQIFLSTLSSRSSPLVARVPSSRYATMPRTFRKMKRKPQWRKYAA